MRRQTKLKVWKNYTRVSAVHGAVQYYCYSLKVTVFLFWIKLDSIMKKNRE